MVDNRQIIIFDGICNLCNTGVKFIIRRDTEEVFCFASMQSDISQKLIQKYLKSEFSFDTFLLIKNGICYERSDAMIEVFRDLPGFWCLHKILALIPKQIRDYLYNIVAKHRYKVFGKQDQCMVPSQNISNRFIES